MSESKTLVTHWIMKGDEIIHVSKELVDAEKKLSVIIEMEALKRLGITEHQLTKTMAEVKEAFVIRKATCALT